MKALFQLTSLQYGQDGLAEKKALHDPCSPGEEFPVTDTTPICYLAIGNGSIIQTPWHQGRLTFSHCMLVTGEP